MRTLCWWFSFLIILPVGTAAAQSDSAAAPVDVPGIVSRTDMLRLGGFALLTAAAYQMDGAARDAVRRPNVQASPSLRSMANFTYNYGMGGVVLTSAALWGGGLIMKNETMATTGLRGVEAIVVSGVITKVIKGVAGRARPRVAPHEPDDFDLGRGFGVIDGDYESFPSGHATAAFAFAAAVTGEVARRAPRYRNAVAISTYGLAAVTAYSRMYVDGHWFSDVTLGAGIGMVSGWAITRWHADRPDNAVDRWLLRPVVVPGVNGETRLGFSIALP